MEKRKVTEMGIFHCKLYEAPPELNLFANLTKLYISQNFLSSSGSKNVWEVLLPLGANLKTLDLSKNFLTAIDAPCLEIFTKMGNHHFPNP